MKKVFDNPIYVCQHHAFINIVGKIYGPVHLGRRLFAGSIKLQVYIAYKY